VPIFLATNNIISWWCSRIRSRCVIYSGAIRKEGVFVNVKLESIRFPHDRKSIAIKPQVSGQDHRKYWAQIMHLVMHVAQSEWHCTVWARWLDRWVCRDSFRRVSVNELQLSVKTLTIAADVCNTPRLPITSLFTIRRRHAMRYNAAQYIRSLSLFPATQ